MGANRAGGWVIGLCLLASLPVVAARADAPAFDLREPDLPAPADLGTSRLLAETPAAEVPASETVGADAGEIPALPDLPTVVVEVPGAVPVEAVAEASVDLPVAPPSAPVEIALDDFLPGAIELRLSDPKLALPPKLARKDREALTAYYASARHRPLWIDGGALSSRGRALAETLAGARSEGLDPADYPVARLEPGTAAPTLAELAEAELKLSAAAMLYARDARGGRLEPGRLSGMITPKLDLPSAQTVLSALEASHAPGEALAGFNPAYPGYRALRAKLAEVRANRAAATIEPGPPPSKPVRQAAARQIGTRVATDGTAPGPNKAAPSRLEGDIVANMERWRWLPTETSANYIVVNIPEFRLRLFESGQVTHLARVATGTTSTQTPLFSGLIQFAVVNPSWYVPPSIMREHASRMAEDPTYAGRAGISVARAGKSVSYRMPPGPRNPLGNIKFMFPNDHAVYLHDTNGRGIFGASQRALSHGCIRLENPFSLGGKIMGGHWTEARLKSLVGHGERAIYLEQKLPISLAYFTVWVDESGEVQQFGDLYGHHRRVRMALGLGA